MTLAGLPGDILTGGAAFLVSLLLALYLTPIFRDSARRFGIVDRPDGRLKTQKEPVPYLGGLAIFAALLLPVSVFLQLSDALVGLMLASSLIVLLGLIDDIGTLSPRIKLLGQVIAVFLLLKSGIRIRVGIIPPLACVALTFLWMIVMTNGFNLIDVMDGLAAAVASVSSVVLSIVFLLQGNRIGMIVCLCLVGALLGFLRFNRAPAQIYLGDTGSMLIGFLLGGLAIGGNYTAHNVLGWITPIVIFSVPLFEILFVSYLRLRRGSSIFIGSRDHFALRLRKWRFSTNQTVALSSGAAAFAGATGLVAMHMPPRESLLAYGAVLLVFVLSAACLKTIDMRL